MKGHFEVLGSAGPIHAGSLYKPIYTTLPHGTIELIMGPMFSGKTELGFQRVRDAIFGGKRAVVIKHNRDVRYNRHELASSHDGTHMRAIVVSDLETDPEDLPADVDLIFVDEGQWFKGLLSFCLRQNRMGRDVVVAALNSYADETRSGWPFVLEVVPRATRITSLTSTCTLCHKPAECSRLLDGEVLSKEGILVGADEKYIATCAGCYTLPIPKGVLEARAKNVEYIKWMSSEI